MLYNPVPPKKSPPSSVVEALADDIIKEHGLAKVPEITEQIKLETKKLRQAMLQNDFEIEEEIKKCKEKKLYGSNLNYK
jgi:phage antirepressor YoqD-like protein